MEAQGVARLLLLGAVVLPNRTLDGAPVLCPVRRLTGLPCPACGLTRSWQAVAHGRLGEGFEQHPLGPLAFTAAAWFAVDNAAEARLAVVDRRWATVAVGAWITVWLWRLSRAVPR